MSKTKVPAIPAPTESNLRDVARAVKGVLDVREGLLGDPLDKTVTFRDLVDGGIVEPVVISRGGTGSISVGPAPGLGSGGPAPEPDLTPPPAPTGLTATAGLAVVILGWTAASYSNHAFTEIWRSETNVIGNAVRIATTEAALYTDSLGATGVTRYYWVRHRSTADVAGPYNATNGVPATTGKIGNTDLGPLIVEAGNLANGSVSAGKLATEAVAATNFANGIEPVTVVAGSTVPTTKSTNTIFLAGTGKLYRWNGTAYTATVPAVDISGTLAAAQIASVAASQITGQLSDTQLAAIGAAKVTGQIVGTQITDGAISTAKLAAGSVTAAVIAADTITAAQIAANAITSSELAAGAVVAGKIAAGSIQAGDIGAGAITTAKLAANAVTANEIAADAITAGKIAAGAVSASQIAAGAITANKIAANAIAVGTAAIQNGAIVNAMLGNAIIDTAKIGDAQITTAKIGDAQITNAKITALDAAKINTGTLDANRIAANSITASKINGADLKITAGGVQVGFDVGPSSGHYGLSLSGSDFNNIFLRRSDGVVFFRINDGGAQSLTFDSASGNLNIRGQINGGAYTGYAWPAINNYGFHLGPNGLLLGNYNNNRYFQVEASGNIYAPGFTIINGSATFSGTLSASIVNTDQIVGGAASAGSSATSTGASVSVTVSVPAGASAILIEYYLGPPTNTPTGGGSKGDPGGNVVGPILTGLTDNGSTTGAIIISPGAGNHTIVVSRSYYTGTMRLGVLVLKR